MATEIDVSKKQISGSIQTTVYDRIEKVANEQTGGNISLALNLELQRLYKLEDKLKYPTKEIKHLS